MMLDGSDTAFNASQLKIASDSGSGLLWGHPDTAAHLKFGPLPGQSLFCLADIQVSIK